MARKLSNQVSRHTTTKRGGNSNGLHVTQGSAPESGRHPQNSPTLDGNEERNGRPAVKVSEVSSFPPSLCALAEEESYGGSDGMTVSAALVPLNSAGAAINRSEYPISPVRLLTLSSPPVESGAEQGATLVSAPGFLPRKFSWASDEDCESLAAAQAGELR